MRKIDGYRFPAIAVFCVLITFFLVGLSGAAAADPKPMVEKMAHMWPTTSWPGRSIHIFGDGIEKATNGRIKFKYFLDGTLYSDYDSVTKSVIDGVQPFCFMYPPMLAVYDQRWNALMLPGAITSMEQLQKVHYESKEYQKLQEEFEAKTGARVLFWELIIPYGDIPFNTKRPLASVEDWKGLKMRSAPMDLQQLAIKAFGASPIVLQTSETLSALSLGTVDGGIITPGTAMTSWKADETLPYLTVPQGGWSFNTSMCGFLVNMKWWNKLPKDLQDAILKELPEIVKTSQLDVDQTNAKLFEKYKASPKNKVTYLTEEQTKVWDDLIQQKVLPQIFENTPGMKKLYEDFRTFQ